MRAVTGELTSSNPISLSKAGAVINRFASSETGARPDVAAYLNRAAVAFNELIAAHREILAQRKISHVEEKEGATHDEDNNRWGEEKKKKKKMKMKKTKGSYFEGEAGNSILELQGEIGVSREKKVEVLGEEKRSEERRYWKENKRKVDRLQEGDRVGLDSGSNHVDRKKRKHSDFEQGEVNGEMKHEEGKRKNKRRTIE